jgi:hypothetical protein
VKLLELAVKYHDTTKPATPPHEGAVIEYVHRVITTESKGESPSDLCPDGGSSKLSSRVAAAVANVA